MFCTMFLFPSEPAPCMGTESNGAGRLPRNQEAGLEVLRRRLLIRRLLCAVLFSSVLVFATTYASAIAYGMSVVFAPHADFLQGALGITLASLHVGVLCLTICGSALLFASPRPRGRLRGFARLRHRIWGKINGGGFGRRQLIVFFMLGVPLVFWCQFLGVMLELSGFQSGATMPINPSFTTHETPGTMKRLGRRGALYRPGRGDCQGRHCVGCLAALQCKLSKNGRRRTT